MFNKVLVTLDGSQLAETVLPWVPALASAAGAAQIVLMSVIWEGTPEQLRLAEGYLRDQGAQLQRTRWPGDGKVPPMEFIAMRTQIAGVAEAILRFAEDNGVDLIMLSTHGRSGVQRWSLGSVAAKIVKGADMPVFLVRNADAPLNSAVRLGRFLVPLDGSKLAEQALPHVQQLARSTGAEVTLLYVAPPPEGEADLKARPLHGYRSSPEEHMGTYLSSIAGGLASDAIRATPKVRTGHPSQEIVQEVEDSLADLIVMSSHGRTGMVRWALGSVADQVVHSSPVPVLLVPSQVKGEVPPHLQGPLVNRCHHCGRRTYRDAFIPEHRCGRCRYFLKACGNCAHFDGIGCILQLPYAADVYPGNRCPEFRFRTTRIVLR